mmetsp:Transcript_5116/g.10546  ORF Transcript_5116/g.10546 Transcript_5116/m.10546 type:complete len:261 (-) Transcript_5116:126-908(-)
MSHSLSYDSSSEDSYFFFSTRLMTFLGNDLASAFLFAALFPFFLSAGDGALRDMSFLLAANAFSASFASIFSRSKATAAFLSGSFAQISPLTPSSIFLAGIDGEVRAVLFDLAVFVLFTLFTLFWHTSSRSHVALRSIASLSCFSFLRWLACLLKSRCNGSLVALALDEELLATERGVIRPDAASSLVSSHVSWRFSRFRGDLAWMTGDFARLPTERELLTSTAGFFFALVLRKPMAHISVLGLSRDSLGLGMLALQVSI